MNTCCTQPPWEFLLTASRNTLQCYELSRLGHASNLRKEISSHLNQWLDENANAMVARWLIEERERTVRAAEAAEAAELQAKEAAHGGNGDDASDNFLADRLVRAAASSRRE